MPTNDELVRRIEALEDAIIVVTFAYGDQTGTDYLRRALEILADDTTTDERTRIFDKMREWSEIRFPSG